MCRQSTNLRHWLGLVWPLTQPAFLQFTRAARKPSIRAAWHRASRTSELFACALLFTSFSTHQLRKCRKSHFPLLEVHQTHLPTENELKNVGRSPQGCAKYVMYSTVLYCTVHYHTLLLGTEKSTSRDPEPGYFTRETPAADHGRV